MPMRARVDMSINFVGTFVVLKSCLPPGTQNKCGSVHNSYECAPELELPCGAVAGHQNIQKVKLCGRSFWSFPENM